MDATTSLLSPLALALALLWNFAVLSSIQLTVRLIRAFSLRDTALASLALTGCTVPITILYSLLFRNQTAWLPAAMVLTGLIGFWIAARVLRFRRQRSTVVAAIGIGILSAPWGAFLALPPP
jgi:putative effector of murein hydrolase